MSRLCQLVYEKRDWKGSKKSKKSAESRAEGRVHVGRHRCLRFCEHQDAYGSMSYLKFAYFYPKEDRNSFLGYRHVI